MTSGVAQVGQIVEGAQEVTLERSAAHLGSGTVSVYATPSMVLFIEQVCRSMIDDALPEGQVTVGVQINLHHLAPTPVGDTVELRAEVVAVDGNVIDFEVEVWDSTEVVGKATHRRVIIDVGRFIRRVEGKTPVTST
ncbi:MAG: thioesterase [Anaerolineales bacterium]|nr:thioesterase [Anaerolineales bacterium]